ncbi:aminoacyltransferase [Antribacter sp. KLBMP9083]|uniref:Aminoacyltransferase n=1 Tax=Antribacter soli TaxID=2910976 RepID=A0AA41QFW9_9MICO|nr:peptidoglycan bridge formation glycyltransferase FemA/FemB family protein [Antribacter soli]MCF4121911.1 aminoacyltransferase [Antribacter soli]
MSVLPPVLPSGPLTGPLAVDIVTDRVAWDREVLALGGHPLQLWGWGEVKAAGAWRAHRLRVMLPGGATAGLAQVLVRPLPAQFRALSYVPRGPVVAHRYGGETAKVVYGVGDDDTRAAVSQAVTDWCRENVGGVGITLEPDWPAGTRLELPGRRYAPNQILIPSTLILDLTKPADELLAGMRKSTRYEIRKGSRAGLDIRRVTDDKEVLRVLDVYKETAERAGFAIHSDEYYLDVHRSLGDKSVLVATYVDDVPACFAWCVNSASTSFLLYGGGNDAGRKATATAPTYWRTIEIAQEAGLVRYDMNGLLNDGISEFKRSFAQHTDELVGSIDVPFSRWYSTWNSALPTAKKVVRKLRGH